MRVTDEMIECASAEYRKHWVATLPPDKMRLVLEAAIGPADDSISDLETTVREMRERIEREIRDMLVEQTRMITKMADNLSGSLGHSIALLAAIDERHDIDLPSMTSIVEAGRTAIQAWQEAMPQIEQSLAALDDSESS